MRRLRAAATALVLVLGVGGAQAGPADVRCAQQGLQNQGFDPGGVDGVIGPGTRAGATAYLAANADSDLPALTTATATTWCGALGGGGSGAVTFVINITGGDNQRYKFHLLGPDTVSFYSVPGVTGQAVRVRATRDQVNQTTGYCVVLPIIADVAFKNGAGDRSKGRCVAIKGANLATGAVVNYKETLFP
jgi:peptidoglycan hydrolase-like protein with peptidoglycan-binding domain